MTEVHRFVLQAVKEQQTLKTTTKPTLIRVEDC